MRKYALTKAMVGTQWIFPGVIANTDGSFSRGFRLDPLSSGSLEEGFEGPGSDLMFSKLSDLLTRLPNGFEGQLIFLRSERAGVLASQLYAFEKVSKAESYSHFGALLEELSGLVNPISQGDWRSILAGNFGQECTAGTLPDLTWDKDSIGTSSGKSRVLSLTELPQVTWKGCFQPLFEYAGAFLLSLRFQIPQREKVRRQLETKRRVSHAMAIASSLEVRNIESNSVLSSSEETLERILVEKETLFEMSAAVVLHGDEKGTLEIAREMERLVSGIGNAGLFLESIGTQPVIKSHLPGNNILGIRKLPILSQNLSHVLPLFLDFSRSNDRSALKLRSRCGEDSTLNLFSKENLNFNAFICGASGSGKSFLMNAILSGALEDERDLRLCIFDIGGSYRKIVSKRGGQSKTLANDEAVALLASFLKTTPIVPGGFFLSLLVTLCGSGAHVTHSHRVALDELLRECSGEFLEFKKLIAIATSKQETFYRDLAHWLKPHCGIDAVAARQDLLDLIRVPVSAFDFKELEGNPVLQKTTILLLSELLWKDLVTGRYPRTLVVFDEVWRFFAQSKDFLEEMYRTLRKYRAGIVSITQNLADYGDEAFAKMLFTNSFTKLFLQSGAGADFLRNTFDLGESDIERAISVASKKPYYSEFFALTPRMSQVFRLYPTAEFYDLANTENIAQRA
jgi:hypothetical protein